MAHARAPDGKRRSIKTKHGPSKPYIAVLFGFSAETTGGYELGIIRDAIIGRKIRGMQFKALRKAMSLSVEQITPVIGSSQRTITRKEGGQAVLSPTEGDRAYRLARIGDLATESIGDGVKAMRWLATPNTYLGNQTPLAMLDTEIGTTYVEQSLAAIAYGGVA
jgi:putative toxin-antitoxin system antitoxin component (TIGR02293 family)